MQFAKLTGIERPNQSSNLLRLPLHGGNQYFEDEKLSKINQFYTPQNRHISQRDPHSSNNYTFSQKIAHIKTNNGVNGSHGHSYSQIHSRMSESPKLRNGLSNSIPNKQEFYRNSLLKDTKRNDENRNAESQESRLARMNFIERQEQVIHKYRPKLHSDAEAYAQNWASQSWNTNIKYGGSPKNSELLYKS